MNKKNEKMNERRPDTSAQIHKTLLTKYQLREPLSLCNYLTTTEINLPPPPPKKKKKSGTVLYAYDSIYIILQHMSKPASSLGKALILIIKSPP